MSERESRPFARDPRALGTNIRRDEPFGTLIVSDTIERTGREQIPNRPGSFSIDMPSMAEQVQTGTNIQRMPDAAYQPEGGSVVNLKSTQLLSSCINDTQFYSVFTINVGAGRKLVIASAHIRFTNPYGGLVIKSRLTVNGNVTRLAAESNFYGRYNDFNNRVFAYGQATVVFEIARSIDANGWNLGSFEAELRGYDVPDEFPGDLRGMK
jgi:hypothetical protein